MKKRIAIAAAAAVALLATASTVGTRKSTDNAVARNLVTFNSIVKELELNYVDSINPDRSFKEAIGAFLSTVDPYTEYYDSEEQEALEKMTTGEYGGIGSVIMERDGSTYVSSPMENSPAAKSGMRPGDRIILVDSTDTSRKGVQEVTRLLRGVPGTEVHVRVIRPWTADSIIDFTLERAKLQEPSVPYYGVIDGGTGYIHLSSFIDKSPVAVRSILEQFKKNPEVKNVVLDLRGNGGGLLEAAVDIVSNFVPKGTEVVRTRYKNGTEKVYKTTRTPIFPDIPLAVLIDGGTASSSEIVAGAIQDLDRGVLIGTRSFGKGLVQTTRPLPYSGLLKVTVAKYYTPSGRLIQALDYAHRNEDGSVERVPDSLTHEYRTLHGRVMRDGGGLSPDSLIDWGKINRIVYNVVRDNWAFDYATKFASEHPQIAPAEEFVITDEIYADFKKSIDPNRFKYDKVMEEGLKQLREIAGEEGYSNAETDSVFNRLGELLVHNLDKDLDTNRRSIEQYLGSEIVGRYYYDRGRVAWSLRDDKALDAAEAILNDPQKYNSILNKKK